jgi:hypothetical protein
MSVGGRPAMNAFAITFEGRLTPIDHQLNMPASVTPKVGQSVPGFGRGREAIRQR